MDKFLIREVPSGFKFDLKAANGQTIATSEVYKTVAACRKGMESVRKSAQSAPIEDLTGPDSPSVSNPKFQIYLDKSGAFRFRLKSRNGQIIAISERYRTKAACENGIESVRENAAEENLSSQFP